MLRAYGERYRTELLESVVPFWMRYSLDPEYGGYFTCLDRNGSVYDTRKYVWLQGRNAWVFSRLYNQVEPRAEWLEAARLGVCFLRRYAFDEAGRTYFSLTREGRPVFFQRKPYAAVFAALAFIEYGRAAKEPDLIREASSLFWRILEWIRHPEALGRPVLAGQVPMSTLSDILVQVMLALELAKDSQDVRYRVVMQDCLQAASRHVDRERGILLENAMASGEAAESTPETRLFSPGSAVEVAWFLLHVLEPEQDSEKQSAWLAVIEKSLEFGWDREYGGLFYFMDVEGKPTLQLESSMKLWWPHTEAIYAVILAYTRTRDPKWLRWLERLDSYADRFRDPQWGEWFGYLDRQGNVSQALKGNNYKGAYHVSRFLLQSLQRIEAHRGDGPV